MMILKLDRKTVSFETIPFSKKVFSKNLKFVQKEFKIKKHA